MNAPTSAEDWRARAASLEIRNKIFIDGEYRDAVSGKTFDCVSPIDGQVICQVAEGDAADIDAAVRAARAAFEDGRWRDLHPRKRKRALQKLADLMRAHQDELALLETLDMGKPIRFSGAVDVRASADTISWYAEAIDKVYDEIAPTGPEARALITREPLGVIGIVVPWNFPMLMACWKLGPALATGNSVVVKPAEQSPLTALRLAELAIEAGIPAGVFNVVPGFGHTAGKALGLHMDVDAIAFTGSTEVGKMFMEYSGQSNLKQVGLECGGKSPHIVMADVPDMDTAARAAATAIFFNQGEVCTAGSRLLVAREIKDEFLEKVMASAQRMQPGDPLHPKTVMGAMVDDRQTERVMNYIESGKAEGAKLLCGGRRVMEDTGGYFIEPTIFDEVSNDMKIAREEIFGPVLSVIPFDTPEEAVKIANDTIYGLAAAVWTSNITTAHRVSRALRAGVVWVNCYDHDDITTPFGGYKQSGFGRDKSLHAMEKYTNLKTTWINLG